MIDKKIISKHIYNDNESQAIKQIRSISDEESLYVYAFNYNWDNGFEIPTEIISNKYCTISVALLMFHLAEGVSFLMNKDTINTADDDLKRFITLLYDNVINKRYPCGKVAFDPGLTKVQEYKILKNISPEEKVFISSYEGIDCNIYL